MYLLPSSFRNNLLNLNPLGSLPTYLCTYSVPRSLTAIAYFKGFTQDWRQNGTLVSPTECLGKTQMKKLQISCLSAVAVVLNASSILQHTRTMNKNVPKIKSVLLLSLILKNITKRFRGFSNWLPKPSITKPVADCCRGNKIKTSSEMHLYQSKKSPQSFSLTLILLNCKPHTQQGTADPNRATILIYVYIKKDEIQLSCAIWE